MSELLDSELGYQTQYTDPITGDINMQARWYSPTSGTFRSRDTYAGDLNTPVSLNRYTYAGNNPNRYWDPTGFAATEAVSQARCEATYEVCDGANLENQRILDVINDVDDEPWLENGSGLAPFEMTISSASTSAAFIGCVGRGTNEPGAVGTQDGCFDGHVFATRGFIPSSCLDGLANPSFVNGLVSGCIGPEDTAHAFALNQLDLYQMDFSGFDTDLQWEVQVPAVPGRGSRLDITFWDGDEWVIFEVKPAPSPGQAPRIAAEAGAQARAYVMAFEGYYGIPARLGTIAEAPTGVVYHGVDTSYLVSSGGPGIILATKIPANIPPGDGFPIRIPHFELDPIAVASIIAAAAGIIAGSIAGGSPPTVANPR